MEEALPSGLESTILLLRKAYPDGIPDRDYFAVLALLGPYMSERRLGEAVSLCSEHDAVVIQNDWAAMASTSPPPHSEVCRVREILNAVGFEEWIREEN